MKTLPVPLLQEEASKYYGSCTFISPSLINALRSLLPRKPGLTLSIGSGIGLVEAFTIQHDSHLIECVEVPALREERKYVDEASMHYVRGTWDTSDRARDAVAWLFLFPRDPVLITKYVERYIHGGLRSILWIGPAGDAAEMRTAVQDPAFHLSDTDLDACLHAGEATLLWRRRSG